MQCFGSVLVRLTEPLGSAEPPNLTEPLSSAEPEPVPERFGLPLIFPFSSLIYFAKTWHDDGMKLKYYSRKYLKVHLEA